MLIEPPADTPEYMHPAWVAAPRWAIGQPEIIEAFCRETGKHLPATRGINGMVDDATGYTADFVSSFVEWFNKNIWGAIS